VGGKWEPPKITLMTLFELGGDFVQYMYIDSPPSLATFGRMLLPYRAEPAGARLLVLQVGGHSSLSSS